MAYPNDPPAPSGLTLTSNTLNNGCAVFYPLTDGSGSTAVDISGNGYDATGLASYVPTWSTQAIGVCAAFTGGQRFMVPQAWWNDNISGGTDFSVSVWVRTSTIVSGAAHGICVWDTGGNRFILDIDSPYNQPHAFFGQPSFGQTGLPYSPQMTDTVDFHHFVLTCSNGGNANIYVDNVNTHTVSRSAGNWSAITADSAIGASPNTATTGRRIEGYQQNCRAWNRELSVSEVDTLYSDPWAGTDYSPNEASGGSALSAAHLANAIRLQPNYKR